MHSFTRYAIRQRGTKNMLTNMVTGYLRDGYPFVMFSEREDAEDEMQTQLRVAYRINDSYQHSPHMHRPTDLELVEVKISIDAI